MDLITDEATQVVFWDHGGPWKIALSQDGQWALTADDRGTVRRVDRVTGKVEEIKVGGRLTEITLVPNNEELAWVSDSKRNTVSLVYWKDRKILYAVPVGLDPRGLAIYQP